MTAAQPDRSFYVLSANLAGWPFPDPNLHLRVPKGIEVLQKYQRRHLWGLQEMSGPFVEDYRQGAPLMQFEIGVLQQNRLLQLNPIAWDKERWRPLEQLTHRLSETPHLPSTGWGGQERAVTAVLLEDSWTDQCLVMANFHLDNVVEEARQKGVEYILKLLKEFAPDYPTVLTADFNASLNPPKEREVPYTRRVFDLVEQAGFVEAWSAIGLGEAPLTFHGWAGQRYGKEEPLDHYGVTDPDHIYVRGLKVLEFDLLEPGPSVSDHHWPQAKLDFLSP